MDLSTHPLKWTCTPDGQWIRIPFVRDEKGDRPASIHTVTAQLDLGKATKK